MKKAFILLFSFTLLTACSPAKIEKRSKGIVLHDNVVVHYREAGQGPVLILIHGLGSSSEAWNADLDSLAKSYRVIAIDLPGFGKSDRPKADYSVRYLAGVVNEFMDSLGLTRATLAGNSLGGWVAALVALENPQKVSNLILVNSAGLRREGAPPVKLDPATRDEEKALLLTVFSNQSFVTDQVVDEQWEYSKEVRPVVQSMLASFKSSPPFLDDRLKDIKVPTLVIWGRQDKMIPLEAGKRFAKGIPGARLAVIENAGHLPQIEQPDAFNRAVKGFVKSW
jgi:pimeloyl-ACP methyl ester carboxylesterase